MRTPERVHRILVLCIGGGVVALLLWGGMQLFSSKFVPVAIPSRGSIRFEPKTEVWNNTLFSSLQAFFTGNITSGVLGKPLPFESGILAQQQLLSGQVSPLASMEEVSLGGSRAVDVARSSDGSMNVLLRGERDGGGFLYEIRTYATDRTISTYATWQTGSNDPVVSHLVSSDDGSVWIGGRSGYIAHCEKNGAPVAVQQNSTGLTDSIQDLAVDGTGRVWATDGIGLALGGVDAFAPFDFYSRVREESRNTLLSELMKIPDIPQEVLNAGDAAKEEMLRKAMRPFRFSVLANGEIGLRTDFAAFIFPLALQNSIRWIDTDLPSYLPKAFDPSGGVYTIRGDASAGMNYVWATGTRSLGTSALPSSEGSTFGLGTDALYALEQKASSTVLWVGRSGNWVAQIVASSGTVPLNEQPLKLDIDGERNVWVVLTGGHLLRIQKGKAF